MILIGLTGGVGMGKSTAASLLRERGWPVIDTDVLARQVVEPGQPAWEEIRRVFGEEMLDAEGRLRRDRLAGVVFGDEGRRRELEAIVHPRIRARWVAQVEGWRAENQARGVVVIPLLFETNAQASFKVILCAACSADTQRERLGARGWSLKQIEQRIQAQWPIEKKMSLAHHVVWTEGEIEAHAGQLERIIRSLV